MSIKQIHRSRSKRKAVQKELDALPEIKITLISNSAGMPRDKRFYTVNGTKSHALKMYRDKYGFWPRQVYVRVDGLGVQHWHMDLDRPIYPSDKGEEPIEPVEKAPRRTKPRSKATGSGRIQSIMSRRKSHA